MSKKTILVVGGAGYIGSHVNEMLQQTGYNTVVLDNLSRGSPQAVHRGILIKGESANQDLLNKIFTEYQIDAVMHFAALTDVGESMIAPLKYHHNNVANTITLLNAMQQHQIKIFIFSSTAAIFGMPQTKKISEDHPCNPINPYGNSKWLVEKILDDLVRANQIKCGCLRYFNAAGGDPRGNIKSLIMSRKETNLIPIILRSLKEKKSAVSIYGTDYPTPDGTCVRDYIHIEDLGTAHILLMEKLFSGMESTNFNLGNGEGFSVRQVIATAEHVTGLKVNAIESDRRPGDPPILLADSRKAEQILGWQRKYPSLDIMIKHAWEAMN